MSFENETWIIDEGGRIIEKMVAHGTESLSAREQVIYSFWVADYSVCNAGDLEAAHYVDPHFRSRMKLLVTILPLPKLRAAQALTDDVFCKTYRDWFDEVCEELQELND